MWSCCCYCMAFNSEVLLNNALLSQCPSYSQQKVLHDKNQSDNPTEGSIFSLINVPKPYVHYANSYEFLSRWYMQLFLGSHYGRLFFETSETYLYNACIPKDNVNVPAAGQFRAACCTIYRSIRRHVLIWIFD
jgi:hypothetical protein